MLPDTKERKGRYISRGEDAFTPRAHHRGGNLPPRSPESSSSAGEVKSARKKKGKEGNGGRGGKWVARGGRHLICLPGKSIGIAPEKKRGKKKPRQRRLKRQREKARAESISTRGEKGHRRCEGGKGGGEPTSSKESANSTVTKGRRKTTSRGRKEKGETFERRRKGGEHARGWRRGERKKSGLVYSVRRSKKKQVSTLDRKGFLRGAEGKKVHLLLSYRSRAKFGGGERGHFSYIQNGEKKKKGKVLITDPTKRAAKLSSSIKDRETNPISSTPEERGESAFYKRERPIKSSIFGRGQRGKRKRTVFGNQ